MAAGETPHDAPNALPIGQRLHEFELRGVIGVGGFGIVYRAVDLTLEREVAIKEYMPAALAGRSRRNHVSLLSQAHAETFALGLQSFVNEAKLLARFDHASLVKVHRFWEEHGTAYMVMPLYQGRTLRQLRLSMSQAPDDAWIRQVLERLLGALEVMHREGVYHRDIAPDNILVTEEGLPVLLDFGAARRVISDRSQALTAILKPNYAPIEQYAESTALRQGPWTDFYALGATLFFLITGKPPLPATARTLSDDQPRLSGSGQGGLSENLLHLCDWLLAPRPQYRPQNVAEVRAALCGRLPMPTRTAASQDLVWQATVAQPQSAEHDARRPKTNTDATLSDTDAATTPGRRHGLALPVSAVLATLGAVAGMLALWLSTRGPTVEAVGAAVPLLPGAVASSPAGATPAAIASTVVFTPLPNEPGASASASAGTAVAPAQAGTPAVVSTASTMARTRAPRKAVMPAAVPTGPSADAPIQPRPIAQEPEAAPPIPADTARIDTRDPRENCGGRLLMALHRCLVRECEKAEHQGHRACQKVRQVEERQRRTLGTQGFGA